MGTILWCTRTEQIFQSLLEELGIPYREKRDVHKMKVMKGLYEKVFVFFFGNQTKSKIQGED